VGFGIRRLTFGIRLVALVGLAASLSAQTTTTRRATNVAALLAYPSFFHGRPIVIVGTVKSDANGQMRVSDDNGSIHLISKSGAPEGLDEIRGEFWDLGRMNADDIRLAAYDIRTTFKIDPEGPWPKAGEVTAIIASAVTAASPPPAPSIRAIVLNPTRYIEQKVSVTGQFSGRNLMGDLPDAPGKSRYDFVLRSADAAIWVINMRPRGKDFDLAIDSRIDSNRWLTVRGTVQQGRGLQWLDAEAGSLALAKPPTETPAEEPIRVPAGPPPEVVFSAPTEDETDVMTSTNVRIQFSRDLDQATLKGRIRASYFRAQSIERGEPDTPAIEFTTQYNSAARVLEIRFTKPLERFRTVKVELLEGIVGTDAQPLKPWTLMFSLGGV
jgi:Big-like domain-containing protein